MSDVFAQRFDVVAGAVHADDFVVLVHGTRDDQGDHAPHTKKPPLIEQGLPLPQRTELVDAVLAETRTVQQRLRDLPSRVGVYFLLAMCLFPEVGYRLVWDKLTAGLSGMPVV
ncbi:transposase domain-containing protein [Streptomyces mirabilis]|uniref:transposase domain-containing protein n=1 Tax=Streptomyces mirabilis TaxID=68239 RepID=UPI000D147172